MTEFKTIFTGRIKGEAGKLARIAASRRAENRDLAVLRLYDIYTDIRIISVEELDHGQHSSGTDLRALGRA